MADYFYPLAPGRETWGSSMTPSWEVTEQLSASGRRRAVSEQIYPRWQISLAYNSLSDEEADALQGFYCLRRGGFEPFYYKDYHHSKVTSQRLTAGSDGKYQLIANINGYVEPVYRVDNLVVYVNGTKTTSYTLADGKLTLSTSGTVTADYEYYLKVHFSGDLSVTNVFENVNSASVTLESVR